MAECDCGARAPSSVRAAGSGLPRRCKSTARECHSDVCSFACFATILFLFFSRRCINAKQNKQTKMADKLPMEEKKPLAQLFSQLSDRVRGTKGKEERDAVSQGATAYPVFNAHSGNELPKSSSTSALPDHQGEPARAAVGGSKLAAHVSKDVHHTDEEFEVLGPEAEELHMSPQERTSLLSKFLKEMAESHVENAVEEEDIPELNVKVLRDNIKRFNKNLATTKLPLKALKRITSWENPSATALTIIVYFSFVYYGCMLFGAIALLLAGFGYTYVKKMSAPITKHEKKEEKIGLMDRLRVLKEAAAKVQNKFGDAADVQERAINLVTWADPEKTLVVVKLLAGALVVAMLVPFHILLPLLQFAVGVKLFFIDALFARSPALRARYDNVGRFLRSLPTNLELENDLLTLEPNATPTTTAAGTSSDTRPRTGSGAGATAGVTVASNIAPTDKAIKLGDAMAAAGCLESEESVLDVFRALHSGHAGRLCVTNRRVVFHHKSAPVSMLLGEITKIEKKKGLIFSTFLEITSSGIPEPTAFVLFDRDAAYDSIQAQRALLKKAL